VANNPFWLDNLDNNKKYKYRRIPSKREQRRTQLLQELLGTQDANAYIREHRSPETHINNIMNNVLTKLGMGYAVLLDQLKKNWGNIVGEDAAQASLPITIKNKILEIEVTNSVQLYSLKQQQQIILEKVVAIAHKRINKIRLVPKGRYKQ